MFPFALHTDLLLASVFWGSLGTGCVVYGKKQGESAILIGGLALVAASYFIPSALALSGVSLLLLGGIITAKKHGY